MTEKLIVNEIEAETVRYIFRRYRDLGSVRLLKEHLDQAGIVSKSRNAPDGRAYGGKPMMRGAIYHMLQTASIAPRSCIRTRPILESTRRSSMRICGRRCRRRWRQTESIAAPPKVITT